MEDYKPEQAERDLKELNVILGAWYRNRESDSVFIQNLRENEYWAGVRFVKGLIHRTQPERRLHLRIGETAVTTAEHKELAPGAELDLRAEDIRMKRTPGSTELREELFVGWIDRLPLSEVARTLTEGGELSVVEAPPAQAAA
jgi:hypothetical protein